MTNPLIVSEFAGKQGMQGPQWRYFLLVQRVCRMKLVRRGAPGCGTSRKNGIPKDAVNKAFACRALQGGTAVSACALLRSIVPVRVPV